MLGRRPGGNRRQVVQVTGYGARDGRERVERLGILHGRCATQQIEQSRARRVCGKGRRHRRPVPDGRQRNRSHDRCRGGEQVAELVVADTGHGADDHLLGPDPQPVEYLHPVLGTHRDDHEVSVVDDVLVARADADVGEAVGEVRTHGGTTRGERYRGRRLRPGKPLDDGPGDLANADDPDLRSCGPVQRA